MGYSQVHTCIAADHTLSNGLAWCVLQCSSKAVLSDDAAGRGAVYYLAAIWQG